MAAPLCVDRAAGGVANTASKIEIRYNGPDLFLYRGVRLIHVVLMSLYCRTERSVCHAGTIYFIRTEGYFC